MTEQYDTEEDFTFVYYGQMAKEAEVRKKLWHNIVLRDNGR